MKDKNTGAPINQDEIYHYLKDIRKIKVMTAERERHLATRMKSNDLTLIEKQQIEEELLTGNLRFVITVAKQYQNHGLDLSDLIAEGNFGLMKAIKNFTHNIMKLSKKELREFKINYNNFTSKNLDCLAKDIYPQSIINIYNKI